jgi:hypothetical protein
MFILDKNKLQFMEPKSILGTPYAIVALLIIIAIILLLWAIFLY